MIEYFKNGSGIHIKKENRGKFTEYKKRTGKTTTEALHSKNPHVRQMANFARNSAKWHHKHLFGGTFSGIATGNGFTTKQEVAPKNKAKLRKRKTVTTGPNLIGMPVKRNGGNIPYFRSGQTFGITLKGKHNISINHRGNLVDEVTGLTGTVRLPEIIVRSELPYRSAFDGSLENLVETTNALSAGAINRLSPTQNIRALYDTYKYSKGDISGKNWTNSLVQGNNGIIPDKFQEEHPTISTGINLVTDIGVLGAGAFKNVKLKPKISVNGNTTSNLRHPTFSTALLLLKKYFSQYGKFDLDPLIEETINQRVNASRDNENPTGVIMDNPKDPELPRVMSHELDHAIHTPTKAPEGFDFSWANKNIRRRHSRV